MAKLEVLYNDKCPICSREIGHYIKLSDGDVDYIKITDQSAADWGLTEDQAAKQLHARYEGDVVVGVDAFIAIWQRLPYYKALSTVVGWQPIKAISSIIYRVNLAPLLFSLHKRRLAKKGET
jgi:predicted DCC family thiol-disulfide oxidoreductase YuxK